MFARGMGTLQDYTQALNFWTLAGNKGTTDAMYNALALL